jgi:predicted dehydrogenase
MNKQLRGATIGAGKMGLAHGTIINSLPNAKLVSVCEPTKLIQNTFKEFAPHISVYDDHRKMLSREDLDFVFITTPSFMHVTMAMDCVEHGCHFFVEKPLSINGLEAKPLIKKLKDNNLVTMTGYMMRYMATFSKANEILDANVIGAPITFNAQIYVSQLFKTGKGWRYDKEKSGGGVIITQATHVIDLISWYFGYPSRLNASLLSPHSKHTEDFGHITFNWDNGLMGWLDSSWSVYNHRMLETTIKVHGRNGNLTVNDDTIKLFLTKSEGGYREGWTILRKPEIETGVAIDIGGPQYTRQDQDFVDGVAENRPVDSDVINAYRVQKIVDAIYISGENQGQLEAVDYNG